MNRTYMVFFAAMTITLLSQALVGPADQDFETIHSLTYNDVDMNDVAERFAGVIWVEKNILSPQVDLQAVYQEKVFRKKLANKGQVKTYRNDARVWIEEKICPQSPQIEKPVRAAITSRYGNRIHPISGYSHIHAGIDFRGETGTPVYAAADGLVKVVGRKGAYGKAIIIDHGNSYTTLYGHLSGYAIEPNEWVHVGQTIGYIGRTGRATGPHLHFEVRCHNAPLNPTQYLGKSGLVASVRFKRKMGSYLTAAQSRPTHRVNRQPAQAAVAQNNEVKDPNYYTRMINLKKLEDLNSKAENKKF